MNATLDKFGYPKSLIKTYTRWLVLLRPQQVTLGSLILICRDNAAAFSAISTEAFGEFQQVIQDIESNLLQAFSYQKLNYLMLMMVDPDVHFHIIPRYSTPQEFHGQLFLDHGWPGPPNLKMGNEASESTQSDLCEFLKSSWKPLHN